LSFVAETNLKTNSIAGGPAPSRGRRTAMDAEDLTIDKLRKKRLELAATQLQVSQGTRGVLSRWKYSHAESGYVQLSARELSAAAASLHRIEARGSKRVRVRATAQTAESEMTAV
jgi:hypothetical protein